MDKQSLSRRRFLGAIAVAVPAGAVIVDATLNTALAQGALPQLDPADPAAKALLYTHDTTKVDKSNPAAARHDASQKCANCIQIQGKDGETWRPCAIFPGKLVNANGWCTVWAKKP